VPWNPKDWLPPAGIWALYETFDAVTEPEEGLMSAFQALVTAWPEGRVKAVFQPLTALDPVFFTVMLAVNPPGQTLGV
jgi:hypothetical protein